MAKWDEPAAVLSNWLSGAAEVAELLAGGTVWLAVTGLSRAGKTVFITSLIHNLMSALHNPHRMPLLRVVGDGRLVAARLAAARAGGLPRFPYQRNIETMADSPADWPPRTVDISEIELDITFAPASALGRLVGFVGGGPAELRLRIVDYPGEWLLDLPLLGQSYAEWSRAMFALWRRGARAEIAADFLAAAAERRHDAAASDEDAKMLHDAYRALLVLARDRHGLTFLQPGRFVTPGTLVNEPYLRFAPLDLPEGIDAFAPGSLGAQMAARFDIYKREVVEHFYDQHFRHYARQIVLVDVLGALLAGREPFEDTRLAIEAILQSFRYGPGHLLARLMRGIRVEKVLFAATKADHVPDIQRDHLAALLRNMAALPALEASGRNAAIEVAAIASVVSTEEEVQEIDGHRVPVVVGRPVGSAKQAKFFVGNVPIKPPRPQAWSRPFLDVPVFEPPALDPSPVDGIPHINLDVALDFLIGDRLQ